MAGSPLQVSAELTGLNDCSTIDHKFIALPGTYSYGPTGSVTAQPAVNATPATPMPMANIKEMMMKLIADNPSFLTSGIPNELLTQMILTSTKNRAGPTGSPSGVMRTPQTKHVQMQPTMAAGDLMKVKQTPDYNVSWDFSPTVCCYSTITAISAEPRRGRPGRGGDGRRRNVCRVLAG